MLSRPYTLTGLTRSCKPTPATRILGSTIVTDTHRAAPTEQNLTTDFLGQKVPRYSSRAFIVSPKRSRGCYGGPRRGGGRGEGGGGYPPPLQGHVRPRHDHVGRCFLYKRKPAARWVSYIKKSAPAHQTFHSTMSSKEEQQPGPSSISREELASPSGLNVTKDDFDRHHTLSLLKSKMRSIVQIKNTDDLCCACALVTAKAKVDQHPQWHSFKKGRKVTEGTRLAPPSRRPSVVRSLRVRRVGSVQPSTFPL